MVNAKLIKNRGEQQAVRLWLELLRSTKMLEAHVGGNLRREFGQSLTRFDAMSHLYRAENTTLPVTVLASQLLASSTRNITGLIDRMEGDGLVRRSPHPTDRRSFTVRLSAKGAKLFEKMAVEHGHWVNDALSTMARSELKSITASMTQFRRLLEAQAWEH